MKTPKTELLFKEGELSKCCCTKTKHNLGLVRSLSVKLLKPPTEEQKNRFKDKCLEILKYFGKDRLYRPRLVHLEENVYVMTLLLDVEKSTKQLEEQFVWDFWKEGELPNIYWD